MEKEFDFKNIGKQMPYRTPDGFFDRMQEQVSARTKVEKHKKQLRMRLVIAATLAAAAMVLGLVFFPAGTPEAEQVSSNSLLATFRLYLWQPVLTTHIRMQWIIL